MRIQRNTDAAEAVLPFLVDESMQSYRDKVPAVEDPNKEFKYKADHLKLYDEFGLPWPAPREHFNGSLSHLDARPYEVVYFADCVYPYPGLINERYPVEWLDANESLTRAVGTSGNTNPWKRQLGTLVCSMKPIMRRMTKNGLMECRQLAGIECLQMIGF